MKLLSAVVGRANQQEGCTMVTSSAGRVTRGNPGKVRHVPAARKQQPIGTVPKGSTGKDPRNEFNDEEWREMVATAAYFRAASRGYEDGSADEDWYEAEAELRERFSAAESDIEPDSTSGREATNIETIGE
jgi:hypothetical protein